MDMVKVIETIVAIIEVIAAIWLSYKAKQLRGQGSKPPDSKAEVKK